jgi:hypothetical protein
LIVANRRKHAKIISSSSSLTLGAQTKRAAVYFEERERGLNLLAGIRSSRSKNICSTRLRAIDFLGIKLIIGRAKRARGGRGLSKESVKEKLDGFDENF